MRKLVADAGLAEAIVIDSAGTGDYHTGELPDPRTREAAQRRGFELDHLARQFTRRDVERFDLVVAMDRSNFRHLRVLIGERTAPELRLLRSFDPTAPEGAEVPDPWSGGLKGFEEVLDQCERACAGLLAHIRARL